MGLDKGNHQKGQGELHAARPKAPYLDDQGRLRIPCDCEPKYRWWQDGQSPFETALELGASDEELEHHVNEIFNPDDWRKWQKIKAARRAGLKQFCLLQ
jgi:hypothetical protein